MTATTIHAWNNGSTKHVLLRVPLDRSEPVELLGGAITSPRFHDELRRAARWLADEPHAVSMKLDIGWTVSR